MMVSEIWGNYTISLGAFFEPDSVLGPKDNKDAKIRFFLPPETICVVTTRRAI